MTHLDAFRPLETLDNFLRAVRLLGYVRNYLIQVARTVVVRNPTIAKLLQGNAKDYTIQDLREQAHTPCYYARTPLRLGLPW